MSFFVRCLNISRLRLFSRSQLLPIRSVLLVTPRANSSTPLTLCRLFFHSPPNLKRPARRSPQTRQPNPQPPSQRPDHQTIDDLPDQTEAHKSRWNSKDNLTVGGIIGTCVLVFGYCGYLKVDLATEKSNEALARLISFTKRTTHSIEGIKEHRYYTLVTSAFMHFSLPHLAFNMYALWGFGRIFIWSFGLTSFYVVYLGSAIAGGLFQTAVWKFQNAPPEQMGAGASGAVLGLVSAFTLINPLGSIRLLFIPMPIALASVITVAVSVGGILFPDKIFPGLGHGDHLGGMAFGAIWWYLQVRKGRVPSFRI